MVRSGRAAALVIVLPFVLASCASRSIQVVGSVTDLPQVTMLGVQPGDQVVIAFYTAAGVELSEVSGERTVDPNGEIFLPFLGSVPVLGAQTPEIRKMLESRYGELYSNPVVEVVTNVSVNITGAVRNPGHFFLSPSSTLIDALARAGGTSSEVDVGLQGGAADPSQVRLVRGGVGTVIDLRPLEISREVVNLQVQSGDWIFVPRARRSEMRDDINFWNSILATLLTLATLTYLIQNN